MAGPSHPEQRIWADRVSLTLIHYVARGAKPQLEKSVLAEDLAVSGHLVGYGHRHPDSCSSKEHSEV